MPDTDYAVVAELMGIKGFSAHEPEDVRRAIQKALTYPGPVLVNVLTDQNKVKKDAAGIKRAMTTKRDQKSNILA